MMFSRLAIICAFLFGLTVAFGQSDNSLHVKAYPGADVGTKVQNAMKSCPAAPIPCILIIDASLAASPSGTMPTLCANCSLMDYRQGATTIGSGMPVNVVTLGADPTGATVSTAAIQTAINNSGTAGICFPAGKYTVGSLTAVSDLVMSACANASYPAGGQSGGYSGQVEIDSAATAPLLTINGKARVSIIGLRLASSGGMGLYAKDSTQIRLVDSEVDGLPATGAVKLSNVFEFTATRSTLSIWPPTAGKTSLVMTGEAGGSLGVSATYLVTLRDVFLIGGGTSYDQNAAAQVPAQNYVYTGVVLENSYTPILDVGENSSAASGWGIGQVSIRDAAVWDAMGGSVPLVMINNSNAAINGIIVENSIAHNSAYLLLQKAGQISGVSVLSPGNSVAASVAVVDGSGNPVAPGGTIVHRFNGIDVIASGTGGSLTAPFGPGPPLRVCNTGEANCRFAVRNDGAILMGAGGASGTWNVVLGPNSAPALTTNGGQTLATANTVIGKPAGCTQYPCVVARITNATYSSTSTSTLAPIIPAASNPGGFYRACASLQITVTGGGAYVPRFGAVQNGATSTNPIGSGSGIPTTTVAVNSGCSQFWSDANTDINWQIFASSVTGTPTLYYTITWERLY